MQQGVGDESAFLEIFYSRLTNYHLEKWTQDKSNSSKLAIYHTFKSELEPGRYLLISNWSCISSLARFRCANHKLAIEKVDTMLLT